MAEILCPKCGTLISLEQSDLDSIVHQVRDEEFHREVEERTRLIEEEKAKAVALARSEAKTQEVEALAALRSQEAERYSSLEKSTAEALAEARASVAQQAAEVERLKEQLQSQRETAQTERELAVTKAVAVVEKERDALSASVDLQKEQTARMEADYKEKLAQEIKVRDDMIAFKEQEIERIKDMRSRQSTKMIGETLEQHCQYEFDRIRATAFPNAYFEKDNEAVEGTKGDFIFRESDEEGNEIISIMFEMKNQEDDSTTKKRNEEHFAKLHKDREKKGCEYAVLVSLLEPESELYNEGIVDVSHRYPKMYVIRPQFFIALISLLRNAAMSALSYKQELALVRQQELDITTFEEDLETFKAGFFKNFTDASNRFNDTIKAIDKAIKDLQTAREKLLNSETHLERANRKLDNLTVKKLVSKNPTMKAKFEALESGGSED